jgi:predicted O-methyltransferase YrrM
MSWNEGYVTQTPYTQAFYHHLNPVNLNIALLMKRIKPFDLTKSFTYCELACGYGVTTNLLAAVYPHAQFYANDFNPTHILSARSFAVSAGLTNVQFVDDSFKEYGGRDLPQFDFIAIHGTYSWISGENRQAIVDFIREKLKIGGVVYVSYNCLPGWGTIAPLQRLMLKHGKTINASIEQRMEMVLQFVDKLKDNKSAYFQNPNASNHWEHARNLSRAYLIHEYFHEHWTALYFDQVQGEMERAKLSYLGSAHLMDQMDHLNLTQAAIDHLATISDPIHRELVRDFYLNNQFRRDIYIKGMEMISTAEQIEAFRDMKFMLVVSPAQVKLEHQTPLGKLQLQESVYQPIVEALHKQSTTIRELEAQLVDKDITLQLLIQAMIVMVSLGYAHPITYVSCHASAARFNQAVLKSSVTNGELSFLCSPMIGNGVHVPRMEQLFLMAELHKASPLDFVWNIFKESGLKFTKDGQVLETEADNRQFLMEQVQQFHQTRRPLLKKLSI